MINLNSDVMDVRRLLMDCNNVGEEEGEMGRVEREIPGPMELCHEKDGKK